MLSKKKLLKEKKVNKKYRDKFTLSLSLFIYYLNKLSNILNVNIDYLVNLSDEKIIKFKKTEINTLDKNR